MKAWIEKNINPLGTEQRRRGSLYSTIARVFARVSGDAQTAVKAHFPYLASEEKLKEHGNSLYIPNIKGDTLEEYRQRVAAASFFLSRAGERSYILDQLETHFGDRFTLKEEFLRIFVKIVDLADADRKWVIGFLDTILDPNILMSVIEWYHFVEQAVMNDCLSLKTGLKMADFFNTTNLKLNGRVKLDGYTVKPVEAVRTKLNGAWRLDGGIRLNGLAWIPATGYVRIPIKLGWGIFDRLTVNAETRLLDTGVIGDSKLAANAKTQLRDTSSAGDSKLAVNTKTRLLDTGTAGDSKLAANAKTQLLDTGTIGDSITAGMRYRHKLNGSHFLNGTRKLNSGIYIPIPA